MQSFDITNHMRTAFMAAGNGLPEIEVLPTDSIEWVKEQLALRDDTAPPVGNVNQASTAPAAQSATFASVPSDLKARLVEGIVAPIRVVVIMAALLLLGIALVSLGAYQFTKD